MTGLGKIAKFGKVTLAWISEKLKWFQTCGRFSDRVGGFRLHFGFILIKCHMRIFIGVLPFFIRCFRLLFCLVFFIIIFFIWNCTSRIFHLKSFFVQGVSYWTVYNSFNSCLQEQLFDNHLCFDSNFEWNSQNHLQITQESKITSIFMCLSMFDVWFTVVCNWFTVIHSDLWWFWSDFWMIWKWFVADSWGFLSGMWMICSDFKCKPI